MKPVEFMGLFEEFRTPSWNRWRGVLERLTPEVREFYAICGRGSGKSRMVALLACAFATREYRRAPGEEVYVGVFGPDRKQAALVLRYIRGLLGARPELERMVKRETRDRIELHGGVVVEVLTSTRAAPRGRSYALAIIEESSFLDVDETAAEPDVELVRAVLPGLGRVEGSLLAVIGTPHMQRGVLYEAAEAGDAEDRVVVRGDTLTFNPSFSEKVIGRAFESDPVSAWSEYGRDGEIKFRSDVAALLAGDALRAVVVDGLREIPPDGDREARAHFDAATGSGSDAAALAVAFAGQPAELAAVRRWTPPFSPSAVVEEAAGLLATYGARRVAIDRYAPGLISDLFAEHGVTCQVAERSTSQAFVELLALVNSGRVRLLDHRVLLRELSRLERRPGGGGREVVGHPERRGAHDDVAAATAGALVAATDRESQAGWGPLFSGPVDPEDLAIEEARLARLEKKLGLRS